jgi:hypothetical protein
MLPLKHVDLQPRRELGTAEDESGEEGVGGRRHGEMLEDNGVAPAPAQTPIATQVLHLRGGQQGGRMPEEHARACNPLSFAYSGRHNGDERFGLQFFPTGSRPKKT